MKNLLTGTMLLFIALTSFAQSAKEDYEAIAETVNYYLVGGTNNDFETLSKAFHSDATMTYINANGYQQVNALEFFKKGMKPGPVQDRKTRIVSIDATGHAAQAKLEIEYDTFYFHDYMQLLKIDGEWKIISKTFYKQDK
ncbi:nuclear transport factor 2 family protein [Ekhidna sp.]|uniref:nuclear transport factor 2 family protein n=1 Tax=Ekhidna sp. TaxID=2608089 RepID=UPI003C7A1CC4